MEGIRGTIYLKKRRRIAYLTESYHEQTPLWELLDRVSIKTYAVSLLTFNSCFYTRLD